MNALHLTGAKSPYIHERMMTKMAEDLMLSAILILGLDVGTC
jgi:hypothetical protein